MKDKGFVNIQGWMINHTPFKGSDLIFFALVFGFTQDGKTKFEGSISYIQKTLKLSKPATIEITKRVVKSKLLKTKIINGTRNYWANLRQINKVVLASKETLLGGKETLLPTSKETLHLASKETLHINNSNNNNNNKGGANKNSLSDSEKKFIKRIGKKQFELLKANPEYFGKIEPGKKLLFAEWLEHRKEIDKPCETKRVIEGQFKHFLNNTEEKIKEAIEIATTGGKKGWIDIKYGFKEVNKKGQHQRDSQPVYKSLEYVNA